MRKMMLMLVFGGSLAVVAGCAPDMSADGAQLFQEHCVACHGPTGVGDGRLAQDLPVAPANLRHLSANNDGVFPAERVMAAIYGYQGKDAHALMPEFGPVLEGPTVIWTAPDGRDIETPAALVALAGYLETLQDL